MKPTIYIPSEVAKLLIRDPVICGWVQGLADVPRDVCRDRGVRPLRVACPERSEGLRVTL